jgi:hypothetical protein
MLHRLVYADWEEPPEAMAFELSYRAALAGIGHRLWEVHRGMDAALAAPAAAPAEIWDAALDLFLMTPALVNVALNYKVCVEQGLPLHPTHYFELGERQVAYPESMLAGAQAFFVEAVDTALAVFKLDQSASARIASLAADIPDAVGDFVYTSTCDKYTWRASEPAKIAALAADVSAVVSPVLLVGAAHGAITSALVLASLLGTRLYFIRLSMFKRRDVEPVIGASDLQFLAEYKRGPVLLFDEDVAKGTTLELFTRRLKPLFDESYSAGVLRHGGAAFSPDFVGRTWYE